ncbi:hypothetical protein [Nevskia sp.]|uniref:hypothetical protein n=1 Tax=Nevskia sp. TaxID=1929292 RepID=UPI0025DE1F5B|nr:hypothetical protein [Nevskia sp.]
MTTFTRSLPRTRRIATRRGDTPQRIAARELGDASRWYQVVAINGLRPPYLVDDPAQVVPGVLLTGSALLIPDDGAGQATSAAADPAVTFGVDLDIADGLLTDDGAGDFALVSGYGNFTQALRVRLGTPAGDLLFHPDYGNAAFTLIGRGGTRPIVVLANAMVRRAVGSDDRVAEARDFTTRLFGDRLTITGTAVAVDGSRNSVEAG